jgi:transcriptional regulator with XRE-family HTH domain
MNPLPRNAALFGYVSRLERGAGNRPAGAIETLANALKVEITELFKTQR